MADKTIQAAHFIGIGGVGMSGIARVAHDQGIRVTGSDMKESRYTKQLKEAGVEVSAWYVDGAEHEGNFWSPAVRQAIHDELVKRLG